MTSSANQAATNQPRHAPKVGIDSCAAGREPQIDVVEVLSAVGETRRAFELEPDAVRALEHLMDLLIASAKARLAGHLGATNQPQTRMDAGDGAACSEVGAVAADMLASVKGFVEEANRKHAAPAPSTIISTLVVKIDTSQIDLALAKVAELKSALASVLPASGFSVSAADLGPLETREFAADQAVGS